MVRFICWALAVALGVDFGPRLARLTTKMAQAAIHAHLHDQMSYAVFTMSTFCRIIFFVVPNKGNLGPSPKEKVS